MIWAIKIGTRFLLDRKGSGVGLAVVTAVLGIAFAFLAMLVSLSVVSGFEKAYEESILGFNAHLVVIADAAENPDFVGAQKVLDDFYVTSSETQKWNHYKKWWPFFESFSFFDGESLRELSQKGIQAVTPFVFKEALGLSQGQVTALHIKGVDPHQVATMYPIAYRFPDLKNPALVQPSILFDQAREGQVPLILGKQLAMKLFPQGLEGARDLKILIPKTSISKNYRDYVQTFRVVGLFESGLFEFDSKFALSPLVALNELLEQPGRIDGFEVHLDDSFKAPRMAHKIESRLDRAFQVLAWSELNEPLFSAMKMEKTLFIVIMSLVILIAAFNVMGVVFMTILKRQVETSILRVMGAKTSLIQKIFGVQGGLICSVGALIGFVGAVALLYSIEYGHWFRLDPQIYFIDHLPVSWPWLLWGVMGFMTLVVCYAVACLATILVVKRGRLFQTFR